MAIIKRLNINKFTTESDNDAFIEKLKQLWLSWSHSLASGHITIDINKDRNVSTQMTAFVTVSNDEAMEVIYTHEKITICFLTESKICNHFKLLNIL